MKLTTSRFSIKHPKRVIIIASVTLVVLAVATYSFFSISEWKSVKKRSEEASTALKAKIDGTLGSEKATESNIVLIANIISDFEKKNGQNPCQTTRLYSWQAIFPAAKDIQTKCEQKLAAAKSLISALKPLKTFLADEAKVASVMESQIGSTIGTTDYAAAAVSWKSFAGLTDFPTSTELTTVRNAIKTSSEQIGAAFDKLVAANKNEDRAAFDAAITELQKAYATLAAVPDAAKIEQTQLVTTVIAAYDKL